MKVDSKNPDSFVFVLDRRKPEQVFDTIIPKESQSKGLVMETFFKLPDTYKDRVGRVSKLMRSGSLVSVAVKHRPSRKEETFIC